MATIFSVEDDPDITDLLKFSLNQFGHNVTAFSSAEDMFLELDNGSIPDIILLDIMLEKMDGLTALKILREHEKYKKIGIIMLTAKSTEMNIVAGLNQGADDYITKPFSVMELSARINALLRKTTPPSTLEIDDIKINLSSREAFYKNTRLELTLKEFDLLSTLLSAQDKVISREELFLKVWGSDFLGETRTLDMHIRTLRQKLGDSGNKIITVRGVGFKFVP